MKIFKIISLCLIISMLMFVPVCARAGGGGSGGGSSGGGFSSHSSSHTNSSSSRGSRLFQIGIFALISSGAYVGFRIKVCKKKNASMKILKQIDDSDSIWDKKQLFTRVSDVYYTVQQAWMQKDLDTLKDYLSDSLYENWKTKIEWMDLRNEKNILDRVKLKKADIVSVYDAKNDDHDMIWVCIEGSMIDYTLKLDTNEIKQGSKKNQTFIEYWKFIRKENKFYLDEVRQKDEMDIDNFINLSEEIDNENVGSSLWNIKK